MMALSMAMINSGVLIHQVMVIILIKGMIFMMELMLIDYSITF